MSVTEPTEIIVNGNTPWTAEEYYRERGLFKDQFRDMVFELALYGTYEAPNGDIITTPLREPRK
jgi:hypothetical protein